MSTTTTETPQYILDLEGALRVIGPKLGSLTDDEIKKIIDGLSDKPATIRAWHLERAVDGLLKRTAPRRRAELK